MVFVNVQCKCMLVCFFFWISMAFNSATRTEYYLKIIIGRFEFNRKLFVTNTYAYRNNIDNERVRRIYQAVPLLFVTYVLHYILFFFSVLPLSYCLWQQLCCHSKKKLSLYANQLRNWTALRGIRSLILS